MAKIIEILKDNQGKFAFYIYCGSLAVAGVMAFKVYTYAISPKGIDSSIEMAEKKYQIDDKAVKAYQVKYATAAGSLKMKNHLTPKAAKPKLPLCTGVIGNKALINGKLYSVGDMVLGAKITDIKPTGATIIWEGKPMQLATFGKVSHAVQGPMAKAEQKDTRHRVEEFKKHKPSVANMPGPTRRPGGPGGGSMGMSMEQMQAMRDNYMSMTPEQQQKFRDERRRTMGGGGGGRPGGGGGRPGGGDGMRGPGGGGRGR